MSIDVLNLSKRKLYITLGEYNYSTIEKRFRKNLIVEDINLELSKDEQKLFDLLMEYNTQSKMNTIIRVAGGWVRDKILNFMEKEKSGNLIDFVDSSEAISNLKTDIDIALNNLSGKIFAEGFNDWLQRYHNYPKHHVGIINRDPEKSKHLETATLKWNDICIDFVGLRSETYSMESRVPIISIGTAEEDAFRRDFTINSMFYNINEKRIEDLTKMGLIDLYNKLIRTPLDPIKTLLDDPLRALRAFRFSSKLHFKMEEQLLTACKKSSLFYALNTKISRERIGSEIHEMVSNSGNPAIGLKLVVKTNLINSVFKFPDDEIIYSYYIDDTISCCSSKFGDWYSDGPYIVELTHRIKELLIQTEFCNKNKIYFDNYKILQELLKFEKKSNWVTSTYFSFMLPLYHLYYKDKKKKEILLVKYIFSNSLKLSNKITTSIVALFDSCLKLISKIIKINSINQLVNKTLKVNYNIEIDIYSSEFTNNFGKELITKLWNFYEKYFKVCLENKFLVESNLNNANICKINCEKIKKKVELGIFVFVTGKMWLEMLISLFCLDIVYLNKKKEFIWTNDELINLFFDHEYFELTKKIFNLKLFNCYEFKNPIDGNLILEHFPNLKKGPKYRFIINFSLLWFIAFTENINDLNQMHVSKCITFIKENCGYIFDENYIYEDSN